MSWEVDCFADDEHIGTRTVHLGNGIVDDGDVAEAFEDSICQVIEVSKFDPESRTAEV